MEESHRIALSNLIKINMRIREYLLAAALCVASLGASASVLEARDLTGDGTVDAFYDPTQDITWLRDGNFAATSGSSFGYEGLGEFGWQPGLMNASVARAWAASLDFSGITGWRLTSGTVGLDSFGDPCTMEYCPLATTEMGTLYGELGATTGPFINVQRSYYFDLPLWSLTGYGPFTGGGSISRQNAFYEGAWAVHDGDVGVAPVIPEPQTYALMLLGLCAIWTGRRVNRRLELR